MIKNTTNGAAVKNYQCLAADVSTLPTDETVADGAICLVVDTGAVKIFHNGEWFDL